MRRFTAKLSSKNQITVPAEVRQLLGIGPGDRIAFEICDGEVSVSAAPQLTVDDLRGVVPALGRPVSDDFDAEIDDAMQDLVKQELGMLPTR